MLELQPSFCRKCTLSNLNRSISLTFGVSKSSAITSPFHVIATSMQLSVLPHLTIYGDVKPEQLKKTMG